MLYLSEFSLVNSAVGMMLPIFLAQETITPPPEVAEVDPATYNWGGSHWILNNGIFLL